MFTLPVPPDDGAVDAATGATGLDQAMQAPSRDSRGALPRLGLCREDSVDEKHAFLPMPDTARIHPFFSRTYPITDLSEARPPLAHRQARVELVDVTG